MHLFPPPVHPTTLRFVPGAKLRSSFTCSVHASADAKKSIGTGAACSLLRITSKGVYMQRSNMGCIARYSIRCEGATGLRGSNWIHFIASEPSTARVYKSESEEESDLLTV